MLNKEPLKFTKAYGTFIGYHAKNIWEELNGFQGYASVHIEVVQSFEEEK